MEKRKNMAKELIFSKLRHNIRKLKYLSMAQRAAYSSSFTLSRSKKYHPAKYKALPEDQKQRSREVKLKDPVLQHERNALLRVSL